MKICIITDDNAGIKESDIKEENLKILPMPIIINGDAFFENRTITNDEFYEKLDQGADVRTSQPSPGVITELWDETLKSFDAIIHIPMSSGLSTECATAKMLAEDYKGKVFVIDNHRISVTLKESVREALYLASIGKTPEEISEYLLNSAYKSTIYIMVDTLKYLKKGGRISAAGALLGGALHIKPVLTILGEKLDAFFKAIGVKKAKNAMIDAIKKDIQTRFKYTEKENLIYQMAYTQDLEAALEFRKEYAKSLGIKEEKIELDPLSLSIATHIGPGSLAVTVSETCRPQA